MRTFIQVLDNMAHWKFQAQDTPVFAPNIHLVEVTGMAPEPEEGWTFDGVTFHPLTNALPGEPAA